LASGKVAPRAVAADLAEVLDSPEVAQLVVELDALRWTGRKGYGARMLIGAALAKSLYGFSTWTRVVALIREHPGLQAALGGCPSLWACYRFQTKLRTNRPLLEATFDRIAAALRERIPDLGWNIAIDSSSLPAYANGMRFVSKNGPERERFSDPDASWGHRSAVSTRKGGGFYGYKIHAAVCIRTGLPLAWQVETARRHDAGYVAPLLDALRGRGFYPETASMDKGYDAAAVYAECHERGCLPVIPLRERSRNQLVPRIPDGSRLGPMIERGSPYWRGLYRGRAAVEREFGLLKHNYGLAPLRVRGLARVQLHADLTILARLALALTRTEVMSRHAVAA
jgi:hypothetical protein